MPAFGGEKVSPLRARGAPVATTGILLLRQDLPADFAVGILLGQHVHVPETGQHFPRLLLRERHAVVHRRAVGIEGYVDRHDLHRVLVGRGGTVEASLADRAAQAHQVELVFEDLGRGAVGGGEIALAAAVGGRHLARPAEVRAQVGLRQVGLAHVERAGRSREQRTEREKETTGRQVHAPSLRRQSRRRPRPPSRFVVHRRPAIDRRRQPLEARLELQRQEDRVEPRLHQVAAVEPQVLLGRRLPHVAQLAFPGAGILGGAGTQAPALADLVRDLGRDQLGGPLVHRTIAGGIDDQVGLQFGAVVQHDGILGHALDLDTGLERDAAVGDQLRGADVDVVARAAPQIHRTDAGIVLAEGELEARLLEPRVEIRILVPDALDHRLHHLRKSAVGH